MSGDAWAVGDPQTSAERFFAVLSANGLLREDGELKGDVTLLSIGDHFDYGVVDDEVRRAGLTVLRWLDRQPGAHILLGNHDVSRVCELAAFDDERFAAAREEARPIEALRDGRNYDEDPEVLRLARAFCERYPDVPTPELVDRDYAAFTTEQRALVQDLLLDDRAHLARVVELRDGREAVATHASVTRRELERLGVPEGASPRAVADALNAFLRERVSAVREAWQRGAPAALDLAPVHLKGSAGREGGGLLYHRPANPTRAGADAAEVARQLEQRRRYDPRDLPRGLLQVCGHVSHDKCRKELVGFDVSRADEVQPGDLRKLVVADPPRYGPVDLEDEAGAATLWLIDGGMNRVPVEDYRLLELGAVVS